MNLSFSHNSETNALTVRLIQGQELQSHKPGGVPTTFCKLQLRQNRRTLEVSKTHKHSANPEYEEDFIFQLTSEDMAGKMLDIRIYDVVDGSQIEGIGMISIELDELDLSSQQLMWKGVNAYTHPEPEVSQTELSIYHASFTTDFVNRLAYFNHFMNIHWVIPWFLAQKH